ncbi:MAG: DNA-3-methyladenine glycosylase [Oscillospiraceae bacterium]|nr:DNA-3-methyladenine glycosylase [Oscillospiraceae bacterium]
MTDIKTQPTQTFTVTQSNGNLIVSPVDCLDLRDTLDCGQAFRWRQTDLNLWQGVAHGRIVKVQKAPGALILHNTTEEEFEEIWRAYFDLDRDYSAIRRRFEADPVLKAASEYAGGIRVLRQEPFETLCSFIISQNNNIPRIKGIIERLCGLLGEDLGNDFSFPSPEAMACLSPGDLAPIRAGFRAAYLCDAAQKVASGEIDFSAVKRLPLETARLELMKIRGVGPKVADCVLLFGLGRVEAFPVDVWIKRVLFDLYDGALPDIAAPYAGIAQQYLFHYIRTGTPGG